MTLKPVCTHSTLFMDTALPKVAHVLTANSKSPFSVLARLVLSTSAIHFLDTPLSSVLTSLSPLLPPLLHALVPLGTALNLFSLPNLHCP